MTVANVTVLSPIEAKNQGFNLAFNLGDLTAHNPAMVAPKMALIQPVMSNQAVMQVGSWIDAVYALAKVPDDQARAIVDALRIKLPRYALRLRILKRDRSQRGRWVAV